MRIARAGFFKVELQASYISFSSKYSEQHISQTIRVGVGKDKKLVVLDHLLLVWHIIRTFEKKYVIWMYFGPPTGQIKIWVLAQFLPFLP